LAAGGRSDVIPEVANQDQSDDTSGWFHGKYLMRM
jgi:hypothetical protein